MSMDEAFARRAWLAGARWARGGQKLPKAASAAFDAWWGSARPLPPQVPQVPDDAPSWWYGHWSEPGRCLYDHRGRPVENPALDTLPLDGGYAPKRAPRGASPQGEFRRVVITSNGDVYTILAWWDRSQGDFCADGNSCFIVRGTHAYASEALVDAFPRHFPRQAIMLAASAIALVEAPAV